MNAKKFEKAVQKKAGYEYLNSYIDALTHVNNKFLTKSIRKVLDDLREEVASMIAEMPQDIQEPARRRFLHGQWVHSWEMKRAVMAAHVPEGYKEKVRNRLLAAAQSFNEIGGERV